MDAKRANAPIWRGNRTDFRGDSRHDDAMGPARFSQPVDMREFPHWHVICESKPCFGRLQGRRAAGPPGQERGEETEIYRSRGELTFPETHRQDAKAAKGKRGFPVSKPKWKMESGRRAAVTTDYTDLTDFTERIGLEITVRTFTLWVDEHSDMTHSKSV